MGKVLKVSEIFLSLQGEGGHAGEPFVFVRLAGCSLGCRWCDTAYARDGGRPMTVRRVLTAVRRFRPVRKVLVTGGEPLEQGEAALELLGSLAEDGYEPFLETNGVEPLDRVPRTVRVVMDVKTPSSGVAHRNRTENLRCLKAGDEVKFVIADRRDFLWSVRFLRRHLLPAGVRVFFSAVDERIPLAELGRWILGRRLPVALMPRLHRMLGMR